MIFRAYRSRNPLKRHVDPPADHIPSFANVPKLGGTRAHVRRNVITVENTLVRTGRFPRRLNRSICYTPTTHRSTALTSATVSR